MVQVKETRGRNRSVLTLQRRSYGVVQTATFGILLISLLTLLKPREGKHSSNLPQFMAYAMSASRILSSGKPYIVYGTAWKKDQTARLVSEAIESGFRFIDTACQPKHYNEAGVGEGWLLASQKLGLERSDLYLQTKYTPIDGQDPARVPYDHALPLEDQVRQSLAKSLDNLHTTYLDALVLHSPLWRTEETLRVWRTFESFVDEGKVLKLGISNCYDMEEFRTLYEQARIKPSILQNRFYSDSNFDTPLRAFCKDKNVTYQSFWTVTANIDALSSPELREIAKQKNLTPFTLMYAFMMSLGHTPLSGTTNRGHMMEDVAVMERMLGGEPFFDEQEIEKMGRLLGMPEYM